MSSDGTDGQPADAFRLLVEVSGDFIAIANLDARVTFINRAGRRLVGIPEDAPAGRYEIEDFLDAGARERSLELERPAVIRDGRWSGESTLRNVATGANIPVAITSFLLKSDAGEPLAFATVQRDLRPELTARRAVEKRSAEERAIAKLASIALGADLRTLFDHTGQIVGSVLGTPTLAIVHISGDRLDVITHERAPDTLRRLTLPAGTGSHVGTAAATGESVLVDDYEREQRFDAREALREGARSGIASPIRSNSGLWGVLAVQSAEPSRFDRGDVAFLEAIAGVLSQAVSRSDAEEALRHLALHDTLTGLPNRALIRDRLEHALSLRRHNGTVAVGIFDLNGFKHVNDSFGHAAGDEVLLECARRLRDAAGPGHTVGRLGGDEFVLICEGDAARDEAAQMAARFIASCSVPIALGEERAIVGATVGISANLEGLYTPSELMRAADEAMYRAKRARIDIAVHHVDHARPSSERGRMVFALREALDAQEITVAYQPIWRLATGEVVGIEALARWSDPRFGDIPPAVFIPIAEETGMVVGLGSLVLQKAARAAVRARRIVPNLTLHVNVSPHELARNRYVSSVRAALDEAGLPCAALDLEITEEVLIEDLHVARQRLSELARLDVAVSLDDFGTGFSSLSYLQRMPQIGSIKIDKSFASTLDADSRNPIVLAIVTMAHALGKTVVAEGVETRVQEDALRGLGCEFGQGYVVSRPVDEERLMEFLTAS